VADRSFGKVRAQNEEVRSILSFSHLKSAHDPERRMVFLVMWPGLAAVILTFGLGTLLVSASIGGSAALGIGVVLLNFVIAGLSVSWAARISFFTFQMVSILGLGVRMAAVILILFEASHMTWVSVVALKWGAVPALLLLVVAESYLVMRTRLGKPVLRLTPEGQPPKGALQ
jgi:hypothetical protein